MVDVECVGGRWATHNTIVQWQSKFGNQFIGLGLRMGTLDSSLLDNIYSNCFLEVLQTNR